MAYVFYGTAVDDYACTVFDETNTMAANDFEPGWFVVDWPGGWDSVYFGFDGDDGFIGGGSRNLFYGGDGDDTLIGYIYEDELHGGAEADHLFGNEGNDDLYGGGGADTLDGAGGTDRAWYDDSGSAVTVNLVTGTGFGGSAQGDTLIGIEQIYGSVHGDTLTGDDGENGLFGSFGDDTLHGGDEDDDLDGGDGNDILYGDAGADSLDGGDDQDTLKGGGGADVLFGNAGTDTASYLGSPQGVGISLEGGGLTQGGDAAGDTLSSIENLTGSAYRDQLWGDGNANVLRGMNGNDTLKGAGGADTLWGGTGNDELFGHDGTDTLRGEADNDILNGGVGNDILDGGVGVDYLTGLGGQDSFLFNTQLNAATNIDHITDFNVVDDTIRLEDMVFSAFANGPLAAERFVVGAAAQDASDNIIYNNLTGALFYDSDGNGAAAAIQFATVTPGLALTHLDFLVV